VSNDTYFYMLAHDLGVNAIANFMKPWGFGQITGIDIAGEARGILPSTEWKRKAYRKPEQQKWYEGETISLGIGQGYNSFTILQLAHATATLANNGVLMKPHLVKEIENPISHQMRLTVPRDEGRINVSQADIDVVKRGMENVTSNPSGTAYQVFRNSPYLVAGKTGTAQVFSLQGQKYRGHALAEKLRDHALFIAFAPAENPKIAVAVIVENGGWGAQAAGPIAKRVLDYYLIDRLKPGAQEAAVSAAASATEGASEPAIGDAASAPALAPFGASATDAVQPVTIAAGYTPLPPPGAAKPASAPAAASDAQAASEAVGASVAAPRAPAGASGARDATAASVPARTSRPAGPHPRRPASDAVPVAVAPSREDGASPAPTPARASGGIDE